MRIVEQKTLADVIDLRGVGVHSGAASHIRIRSAEANSGIVFQPMRSRRRKALQADWRQVVKSELCTTISDGDGFSVATIEHLMSALAGVGVDNAVIEIDGPEVPILDGSAQIYVQAIDDAGVVGLGVSQRVAKVRKSVRVARGAVVCELSPSADGLTFDVEIDFAKGPIGRQRKSFVLSPETYRDEIAAARTFGDICDLDKLQALGFARGSSLENTIALDGDRILNREGLRFPDEFVRHKALDAVGDLSLAGVALEGTFKASRPSHAMNTALVAALFSDAKAYEMVQEPMPAFSHPVPEQPRLAYA